MKKSLAIFLALTSLVMADPPEENEDVVASNEDVVATVDTPVIAEQELALPPAKAPPKVVEFKQKSSTGTLVLSIIPGLGHLYLGEYTKAAGLATAFGGSWTAMENARTVEAKMATGIGLTNTWFYGMYSSYRDVRNYNHQAGYRYPMPNDSLLDLAKAPFQVSVMKKKEVWGGILGFLAAGATVSYFAFADSSIKFPFSATNQPKIYPALALPVGIGEEAFFRGFIQSHLMELSSPVPAIVGSSLIFGAMHASNATEMEEKEKKAYYTYGLPLISSFGGYMGWLTYKTNSLKYSTAVHAWYDFIVFSAAAAAQKKTGSNMIKPNFAYSVSY